MRVAVVSYEKEKLKELLKGHKKVWFRPEVVVCFGGDGTLLYAEQKYPGVKKIFFYKNCRKFTMLDDFKEEMKLDVFLNGKKVFTALNDVNIHYRLPRALRFSVKLNCFELGEIIGDGVVIATPFGSNAYYKIITGGNFNKGIGIAFNNCANEVKSKIVDEDSAIEININRENGFLGFDTCNKVYELKKGDKIIVKKSKEKAYIAMRRRE